MYIYCQCDKCRDFMEKRSFIYQQRKKNKLLKLNVKDQSDKLSTKKSSEQICIESTLIGLQPCSFSAESTKNIELNEPMDVKKENASNFGQNIDDMNQNVFEPLKPVEILQKQPHFYCDEQQMKMLVLMNNLYHVYFDIFRQMQ